MIEHRGVCIMVDCGFGPREALRRLARLGVEPASVHALFLTHEHTDHVSGALALARRLHIPVHCSAGTRREIRPQEQDDIREFAGQTVDVDGLGVDPYPVPHDAREPVQFVVTAAGRRLGILTDVGMSTPHIERMLTGCDALFLECNHDRDLLRSGGYPEFLKARIGGRTGHLANADAAALLERLDRSHLQHVVAAHLSRSNNTPALARAALAPVLDWSPEAIVVADQDAGTGWIQVD